MSTHLAESLQRGDQVAVPGRSASGGLKHAVLNPWETLAQSIAGIAPSATPGMLIPIVFGFAGNGTWLSYLLATIGILFTAKCINEFACHSACPGSLYTFVSRGIGPGAGILTGWALLFAYIFCGSACIAEFAIYAMSVTKVLLHLNLTAQAVMLAAAFSTGFVAYKNIKLSATLMLWLEFASISLILLVVALTLSHHGPNLDLPQLQLTAVKSENVRMGLVMAIFGFVGFESSASLGTEAHNPLKSIPQAIMRSVLLSGLFFVLCSYAMVLSFQDSATSLAKCSTPLLAMSDKAGIPILGQMIDIGIMMSFYAAGLANLNAAARTMYKMSHDGMFHDSLSQTHETNKTPHKAVIVSSCISLFISITLASCNYPLLDIVGWLGTLATFGFIFAYLATSWSAARMLKRQNEFNPGKLFVVSASIAILLFSLIGSIYPAPPTPYNWLPWAFATYMVIAIAVNRRKA
jgi:amino acid transporter